MKPSPKYVRVPRRILYRLWHSLSKPHIVTSSCCGLYFTFSSDSRIGEGIYANAFERMERAVLDQVITPGMTVLDVGANVGFYTCLFARKVGSAGRVIAFEPTPATFELLVKNVKDNGFHDFVECHQYALSNVEGTAKMYVYPSGSDAHNSLGVSQYSDKCASESVTEVRTRRMDDYLESLDLSKGCFIKIDVEGFESQVLEGGVDQLNRIKNLSLMVEVNESTARQCNATVSKTCEILKTCGLEAYQVLHSGKMRPFDSEAQKHLVDSQRSANVFFFRQRDYPLRSEVA